MILNILIHGGRPLEGIEIYFVGLLICKATLKLSLSEKEDLDSSSVESENEIQEIKKEVKIFRKRRKRKKPDKSRPRSRGLNKDHSDSEIQYNKSYTNQRLSVFDLIPPAEKLTTTTTCQNKTAIKTGTTTKMLTEKKNEITIQLAEVQAKLYTLKNKFWFGTGNGDGPISWGCSQFCFSASRSVSPQKTKGAKQARKKSAKNAEKNVKKATKTVKMETGEKSGKNQLTGLKRQTAYDWAPAKIRKSKSLPDNSTLLSEKTKQLTIADDNYRQEKLDKSVSKLESDKPKRKKKKSKFSKKVKAVSNAKAFVS